MTETCPQSDASDATLLQTFAREGSEEALGQLVSRYSGLVLSAAHRITGCPNLAADAAGITFAILARKAAQLRGGTGLGGWLHRTATFEAMKIAKREQRHRRKLQALATAGIETLHSSSSMTSPLDEAAWHAAGPHLDKAIQSLSERDRCLIIERFYRERTLKDIARQWGDSEAAVKKRSQRALQKLAHILKKRGVTTVSATLLASGLTLQFIRPATAKISDGALAKAAIESAPATSLATILSNTLITMSSIKTAGIGAAVVIGLSLVAARLATRCHCQGTTLAAGS